MSKEDAKRLVLARRARFVAAALAGASIACGKDQPPPPQVCLSVPIQHGDADTTPPGPCLSVAIPEDAAPDEPPLRDAGASDAGSTSAKAKTDAAAAPPVPCLSIAPPRDAGTRK